MATLSGQYKLAKDNGLLHASVTEEGFATFMKDPAKRKEYYDYVQKNKPGFYSEWEKFNKNVDDMLAGTAQPSTPAVAQEAPQAVSTMPVGAADSTDAAITMLMQQKDKEQKAAKEERARINAAQLPISDDDRTREEQIRNIDATLSKVGVKRFGNRMPIGDEREDVLQQQKQLEQERATLQGQRKNYMAEPTTVEEARESWIDAWSENTEEGKQAKSDMEKAVLEAQNYLLEEFKKSDTFKSIYADVQGKVNRGELSVDAANKELNTRLEEAFVAENEELLNAEKNTQVQAYVQRALKADNGWLKRQEERLETEIAQNVINVGYEDIAEEQRKEYEAFSAQVGDGFAAANAKSNFMQTQQFTQLGTAYRLYQQAETRLHDTKKGEYEFGSFAKDTFRHLKDSFQGLLSGGATDVADAAAQTELLLKIAQSGGVEKADLTNSEAILYDAMMTNLVVEAIRKENTAATASAGKTLADMIPFVIEIAAGRGLFKGMTEAAQKAAQRAIIRSLGRGKWSRVMASQTGELVSGLISSTLTAAIAPSTYQHFFEQQAKIEVKELEFVADSFEVDHEIITQDAGKAYWEALKQGQREIFTETGGMTKFLKGFVKATPLGKMFQKSTLGEISRLINDGRIGKFFKQTAYDGIAEEWLEESEGTFYDAVEALLNAEKGKKAEAFGNVYGEFFSPEVQVPMLIAFSVPAIAAGGVNGTIKTGRIIWANTQYKRAYQNLHDTYIKYGATEEKFEDALNELVAAQLNVPIEQYPDVIRAVATTLSGGNQEQANEFSAALSAYMVADANLGAIQEKHAKKQRQVQSMIHELEAAEQRIAQDTHATDGMMYHVEVGGMTGYVVSGPLALNQYDGEEFARATNSDIVTVRMEDGSVKQVAANQIKLLEQPQTSENAIEFERRRLTAKMNNLDRFKVGDVIYITENGLPIDEFSSRVVDVTDEGIVTEMFLPDGTVDTTTIPHDVAENGLSTSDELVEEGAESAVIEMPGGTLVTMQKTATGDWMQVAPKTDDVSLISQREFDEMLADSGAKVVGGTIMEQPSTDDVASGNGVVSEEVGEIEQPTEQPIGQPAADKPYATDEQGNPLWADMNTEQAAQALLSEVEGDKELAKQFAQAQVASAKAAVNKANKRKPQATNDLTAFKAEAQAIKQEQAAAQAELSKWENVMLAIANYKTEAEQAEADAAAQRAAEQRAQRKQTIEGVGGTNMAERLAASPRIDGNAGSITAADGTKIPGHYVLVSANALTPSHNPNANFAPSEGYPTVDGQSINDRDYQADQEEQAKVQQVAQTYDGRAITNMPVVSNEGLVYSGNGRTMAGQLAAANGTDGAYTEALKENATQFGFTPEQVDEVPNARVVFMTDERLPYNTSTLALFNMTEQQTQSNTAAAAANVRKLTPEAVGHIIAAVQEFDTVDAFFTNSKAPFELVNQLIADGIISERDKAAFVDNGLLTATGKDRLTALLFGTAFDEKTIRLLGSNAKVRNSVMRALPQILENKGLGDFSLFEHINNAIQAIYDMDTNKMSFFEFTRQIDIEGKTASDKYSAFELLLVDEMYNGGVQAFRDVLNGYNTRAKESAGGQMDLFTGETLTTEVLTTQILEQYEQRETNERGGAQSESAGAGTQEGNGKTITDSAASEIIEQITADAEEFETIELTPSNWVKLFGEDGLVDTPIGKVKMGEGQFLKLMQKGRDTKLGMIKPTLERPSVIIEDRSKAKEGQETEREFSYVFVKAFTNPSGERLYYFTSVTVQKDSQEVVISNQEKERSRIMRLLKDGKLAYINKATLPLDTDTSIQGDQLTNPVGGVSADKGTKNVPTTQENVQKTAEEQQKNADLGEKTRSEGKNTVFTDEMLEAARQRMRNRMNRLNVGLDPEMLADGIVFAGYYMEKGVRKFADFAKNMIAEFGDAIRPYLKAFYNGLRDMPEAQAFVTEMDDYSSVAAMDVNSIVVEDQTEAVGTTEKEPAIEQPKQVSVEGLFNDLNTRGRARLSDHVVGEEPKWVTKYKQIKEQYPDAMILFRVGDFYEVYMEDANDASNILGITLTKRGEYPMAGFPFHALDTYLPKIVRAGKRVAIADNVMDEQKVVEVVEKQENLAQNLQESNNNSNFAENLENNEQYKENLQGGVGQTNAEPSEIRGGSRSESEENAREANDEGGDGRVRSLASKLEEIGDKRAQEEYLAESYWWHDYDSVIKMTERELSKGKESEVHFSKDGNSVIKLVDYSVYSQSPADFLRDRVGLFNELFPQTAYTIVGVTERNGKLNFVLSQPFIKGKPLEVAWWKAGIEEYNSYKPRLDEMMREKFGMENYGLDAYQNDMIRVQDLHYNNIIEGEDGQWYVVDAITSYRDDVPGKQETPEANEPQIITDAIGEIKKSTDTRDGSDIWLVNPTDRVSNEEFKELKKRAKAHNGYYSSFKQNRGFLFRTEEDAIAFNRINENELTTDQVLANTGLVIDEAETTRAEAETIATEQATQRAESSVEVLEQVEQQINKVVEKIDNSLEKVNDQMMLLGYYESEGDANEWGLSKKAEKAALKDVNKVANQLARDLGVEGKIKASANIAPAGGDISFRIPLLDGKELYVDIPIAINGYGQYYNPNGNYDDLYIPQTSSAFDSIINHILYRIETPSGRGSDRYGTNHFAFTTTTYNKFLENVRYIAKGYAPIEQQNLHGYKIGDKVLYKGKEATIYDFNDGDLRPVLDAGLAPVLYEVVDWEDISPINAEKATAEESSVAPELQTPLEKAKARKAKKQTAVAPTIGMGDLFADTIDAVQAIVEEQEQPTNNTQVYDETSRRAGSSEPTTGNVRNSDGREPIEGRSETSIQEDTRGTDRGGETEVLRDERSESRSGLPLHAIEQEAPQGEKKNTRNNHVERGVDYAPKTPKERFEANFAAIKLLKELEESGKQATKAQMKVLRKFSGWGGLGSYFPEGWVLMDSDAGKLKQLLTPEEYDAANMSRNSAYFTPGKIIDKLWDIAAQFGFKGGNILEGSAGIGEILARVPQSMNERSNIMAVEIDPITGGILKQLYPDAQVEIDGFQNVSIPNGSQDLVITNVPFVRDLRVIDKEDMKLSKRFGGQIQDFCIAKNITKLREGGLGIFIAGKSTLDNSKDLRRWIVNEANCDVVGAFRLNKDTFGGTGATADIIVVKKRVNGAVSPNAINVLDTEIVRIEEVETEQKYNQKKRVFESVTERVGLSYNQYYVEHPESMGGEMYLGFEQGDTRFGGTSAACYPQRGINQEKRLDEWVAQLGKDEAPMQTVPVTDNLKEYENTTATQGSIILNSKGEICIANRGKAEPLAVNANKVKGQSKEQVVKDYQVLKDAISNVLSIQEQGQDEAALAAAQKKLNAAYDSFVKKYGYLNKNTALSFLRNDVDFPSVAAIEKYEETETPKGKQVKVSKTDIFSKRVIGAKTEPKPTTTRDAVVLSVQQFGRLDTAKMAEWLGKNEESMRENVVRERLGFIDPETQQLQIRHEYLSGNVRQKLAYAQEHNEDGKYDSNIEELEKVIPMTIPSHLIEFSLGSTWIDPQIYADFVKEKYDVNLTYAHVAGVWSVSGRPWNRSEKNRAAGVRSEMLDMQVFGDELFLSAMNNVPYIVSKQETYYDGLDKKTRTVTDKSASQACATRIDEIRDEFTEWARQHMQKNEELGQRMEQVYNERFNAIVPMEIDEQFTTPYLPGMNPNAFPLYPIQQKAIVRGTMQPVLLAHEVGTGKTRSLISTAMEMRRLGTAKKPMIVVQNATVMQFVNEAKELFPNAKVLTCNEKDRTSEGRREFYAKIKYNDWDMIVVPQSVFDMIPDSEERMRDFIQEKIDEKLHAIEQARAADLDNRQIQAMERELGKLEEDLLDANVSGKKQTKKDEKKEQVRRENAKTRAEEMLIRQTDDVADFDKMGIDALLVDEAHNYKHLGFATMMQRGVKGIDPSYSKRAAALYLKVQAVFEKSGGKNVVFATGTPISNTAAEIWTFMKYLLPKEVMKENEIYYFDDFVRNFGKISQSLEFATNGKFKENTRFASYVNIPELARIWGQITDTRLSDEVKTNTGRTLKEEKIPTIEGGKQTDIFLEQSESLVDIMNAVRSRLEEYENMSGAEKKENSHIPLTMYGIAKRAAIDPRLVDSTAADEPESKTNKAVEETLRALKESKKYNGTVAIFCDNYRRLDTVNGKRVEGFNIFEEIRNKLIAKGVPADQIVIMKSGMTDKAKQQVFDDMNAGTKRVILGSTQTLGTGVNIQTRLFTLIHMDAPDRPMDMTQREGRILRQGNMHKAMNIPVRILRFGVKDSLDVTGYQRLQTKSRFIDSIMRSKDTLKNNQEGRVIEEDEEGLYDNPVAVLSGSQYAMLKSQAEREYRKLLSKQQQHNADQVYIENQVRTNHLQNQRYANFAEESKKRLAEIEKHFPNGKKPKTIVFNGVKTTSAEALDKAIKEYNKQLYEQVERLKNGNYYGDERKEIRIPVSFDGVNFELFVELKRKSNFVGGQRQNSVDKALYYSSTELNIDKTPASNTVALAKLIEEITDKELTGAYDRERIAAAERRIAKRNSDNAEMEKRRGKQFGQTEELNAAKKRVDEYTELMRKELAEKEEKYANRGTGKAVGMDAVIDAEVENDDTEMRVIRKSKVQNVATEIWNKYQYDGELESMRDVAEYAEEHMPKNAQTQALFDAIDAYRIEAEEDRMYYGMRGDLEPFEDAIMDEVERLMNATTQSKLTESEQLTFDALQDVAADAGLDVTVGVSQEEALKAITQSDEDVEPSIRTKPAPKKTGIGYKVFYRGKDGKLYPPMVANPNGADTPIGVWLDADAAPMAGESKTGRPQVKAGGKGTQGGSGTLAYRPGWHLGEIPYALQFNRKDETGERTLFPKDFVWAEVEYADDVNYQEEAESYGYTENGKYRHSYAGLPRVPENGSYRYRTNPNPLTDPWIITGAMKVNRVLTKEEVDEIVRKAGREPQPVELLVNPINGTILGYAQGNRIVLTREGMNPETMVHEYTHVWAKAMQRKNRAGWENIKQIFRESPLWNDVVNDPNYQGLKTDDAICSEVLARYSGKYGAERLDEVAREMILEEQQSGSNLGAARVRALINRARIAIKSFWKWVDKNLFGITKFDSQEDVADRVLYDLLNATDLDAQNNEGAAEKSMERPSPEFVEAMRAWNAANPYPQFGEHGVESVATFSKRLNAWKEARDAYRRYLYEQATREMEEADPITEPLMTEKPVRRKDETTKEYAQRLKLWQDGMIDRKLQEEYTAEMNRLASTANQAKRAFIDAAQPIEEWQNWLVQRGAEINGDSNAYQDMFLAQGRVTDAADDMRRNIIQPLASKIGEIIDSKKLDSLELRWSNMDVPGTGRKIDGDRLTPREIIGVYCQAKDCEEAEEKGLPDRGKDGFINNLGVSYDTIVSEVESRLSAAEVAELWDLIRKATKYALEYDYKSGRISEDTYNEFQDREYYVPQRGWRERDESGLIEEYEPVGKRGHDPYNAALVKARGRKTLAADPFAYIMSIDHSSIVSSENNKIKQKMLQFCLENEELGLTTGAFRVKKYWLMHEIDPDTGKILKDEDGAPIVNISYTEPSAEEKKKDNQTKEQIKRIQKDIAKNKRQIEAGVGPKLETALKAMIDRWEKQVAELEDTLLIAWGATNTHISQRTRDEKMQHEVQVMKDGQRYVIELQDEKVANAINKRFKEHQQALFSVSDKIRNATRFMSAMLTQYNPEFAFSNFVRDYQVALATLLAENPELAPAFVANFVLCQRAVWAYAFNDRVLDRKKFVESDMGRYLQEYMASGAPTGFSYMQDLKSLRQDFDKMVNQGNVKRGIRAAAGMFALMTEWSETAVRFSAYVSARKAGWSVNDAAYMSKELTTNFDRAGEMADSGWMAWFSFFRATVNGNIKFFRAFKKFPIAYSIIAAAYFAAGIANQFMNPNDPDDEVLASDFTRETNFVIGKWRIPVAHFMRIFFGAGVNLASWMQGTKSFCHAVYNSTIGTTREILPNYTDVLGNFTEWSDQMGRVVPKEPKKAIRDVAPTFISPWVDVWTNRNFMGGTINREPFVKTQANTKDILMAKDNTLPIYKAITEGLYTAVGGDLNSKYKSDDNALTGLFDISGSSVQHIAEGYFTGGMDMVATTANMIYDAVQGNELTPDKMAFIRKFYNPYTDKRAYDQQYWLLKGIVQEYERTLRDHEENNPDKYELDLHSKQYQAYEDTHELIWEQIEEPTKEDVKRLMEANKQWVQARK